ncbi:MAG: NAD(P)-dependent oxidoreductase [Actinobacteria bacterium]|nr:NAD(P)-dependent oxidoreductase [Actinomycetota bacterium]
MTRTLITGSAGFIGGYVVQELLHRGHQVVGLDNFSKYGRLTRSFDDHPDFTQVEGDAKDAALLGDLLEGCDYLIAGAAMIGGITYFHSYAYDLIAENERIIASTFDAALEAHRRGALRRVLVLSSSMVFESATEFPSREGSELEIPPPRSSYGFQKLSTEYFARAAWEQHRLPYVIVRPFNCVGVGEGRARGATEVMSGNITLAMSHVLPDLVQKVLKGQDPLHILGDGSQVRHYTYGGDIARGIAIALEHEESELEDFNISTSVSTTVIDLARLVWRYVHGDAREFRYVSDPPFPHDVQMRIPATDKAERVLGFKAATTLEEVLDEVVPWIRGQIAVGAI